MSATATTVETTKGRKLSADKDLSTFDSTGKKLIAEMQAAGWLGYMTNRGHAFMYAPDGITTASVSRDSLRGRSGRNARAVFVRWLRDQVNEVSAKIADKTVKNSFGLTKAQIDAGEKYFMPLLNDGQPAPNAMLAELRRSQKVRDFWAAVRKERSGPPGDSDVEVVMPDREQPHSWAMFDTRQRPVVLVEHGSTITEEGAWAQLLVERPDLFASEVDETSYQEDTVLVHICNEGDCDGRRFESIQGFNMHRMSAHSEPVTCEECGQTFGSKGALGGHRKKHTPKLTIVPPAPTVTDGDAPVAPPVIEGGATVAPPQDVLMEHLEGLPEGADAEAMIATIRAVVAAPLVAEVRRLRDERAQHLEQISKLENDNGELEARLSLMREALGV